MTLGTLLSCLNERKSQNAQTTSYCFYGSILAWPLSITFNSKTTVFYYIYLQSSCWGCVMRRTRIKISNGALPYHLKGSVDACLFTLEIL